jgi:hypothetical protein
MDARGGVGLPYRAIHTTEIMLRAGTITRENFLAGERFHRDFVKSGLDPLAAADLGRLVLTSAGSRHERAQGSEHARDLVMLALATLGGPDSTLGSCAYHCLGRELSLRQWAIYRGANRRQPVNFSTGILAGALDLLRIHYFSRDHRRLG